MHAVTRWLDGPLDERDHVDAPAGLKRVPLRASATLAVPGRAAFGNIFYWNEPERGGHFAALEQPALFVGEVTTFFALVR